MPEHGGDIAEAARRWGIAAESWLDLSTGISPFPCPVPHLPRSIWQRLPDGGDALLAAACNYYGTPELIAVPGSQAAIQQLPKILCAERSPGYVNAAGRSATTTTAAIVSPTYAEYQLAWENAGARVEAIAPDDVSAAAGRVDVLVLCNPNNPTGRHWPADELLALHARLAARGAWLIVDEAFVDATPEFSLAAHAGKPGLVVLRSLGKFFGLAGARVGFVLAPQPLRERLQQAVGPWAVTGPSEAAATAALANTAFHARARERLGTASRRLNNVLRDHGYAVAGLSNYFAWVLHARSRQLQKHFAQAGILIRVFDQPSSFRLGLPGTAADWRRFIKVLKHVQALPDCRNE